jgi:hypothetical protein
MILMMKIECTQPLDLGRAGNFKAGQKYLARFSRKGNLVARTGKGVWVSIDDNEEKGFYTLDYFECYDEFFVDSYHQV